MRLHLSREVRRSFSTTHTSINDNPSDEQGPQLQPMPVVPNAKEEKEPSLVDSSDAKLAIHKPAKEDYE